MRIAVRLFALLTALLFLSLTAAAQSAPHAIPANDLFENARRLVPGKPVVVSGIELAAWEINEPAPTCSNDDTHSVWFRVNLPLNGEINVFTHGTALSYEGVNGFHPAVEKRVTLSLYEGASLDELDELACEAPVAYPHSATEMHGIGVSAGFDVYIRASVNPALALLAPSQLRIQIVAQFDDILTNSAFYEGMNGWTVANGSNDKAVNNDPSINDGFPAFKFTGNPGQNATLSQKRLVDALKLGTSAVLEASALYAHDVPGFEFRMVIKVTYLNGTKQKFVYRETRTFTELTPDIGWLAWYPLQSGKIKSVQVVIPFSQTSGTLVITGVNIGLRALAPLRN
jgi:hypothetical protein